MNDSLTVYTLPGCKQCDLTKHALDGAGVPYVVVDLATDESAVETVKQLGYSSAPVVVIGAANWSGFRPDKIQAVAAARSTEPPTMPAVTTDKLGCRSWQ
ncbi:glutaredoxin family protein [Cryobacterium sp. TMT3-29-2]|uniref:glutaredoxin family protein n=1 Tax=Cryobacterium sp. TMT3-29-2 TaxID=2555867 RepID=UPI00107355BB|nr:glutaredoxin family protein [Cryobacterium sp. TMT3-29-2]TFC83025.1 glutaredoxin family protein [Cryobacterium sp. TMT3-29-2]